MDRIDIMLRRRRIADFKVGCLQNPVFVRRWYNILLTLVRLAAGASSHAEEICPRLLLC